MQHPQKLVLYFLNQNPIYYTHLQYPYKYNLPKTALFPMHRLHNTQYFEEGLFKAISTIIRVKFREWVWMLYEKSHVVIL